MGQTRHGAKPAATHENESSLLYSVDSVVCLVNIYPLDSDLGSCIS